MQGGEAASRPKSARVYVWEPLLSILVGIVLLAGVAYASALSYVLRDFTRARLARHLTESQQAHWFGRLDREEDRLRLVASCVRMAATLAVVVWVFGTALVGKPSPQWRDFAVPALLSLAALAVFSVGLPHALAISAGEAILARSLGVLWALRIPLLPLTATLSTFDRMIAAASGRTAQTDEEHSEQLADEIREAVSEGEIHGAVDGEQRAMIESVLQLDQVVVSRVMTPRTSIEAVPLSASLADIRNAVVRCGHSRIPVYEQTIDQIVGVAYAKDLLRVRESEPFELRRVMRKPLFVPETKTLDALLEEFRQKRVQLAVVLDEYGGVAGVATLEDILEELVGDIADEHEPAEALRIRRITERVVEADARVSVSELNDELGIELPDSADYDTLSGLVVSQLGRIPQKGEAFDIGDVRVSVLDAEPRRIHRLRFEARPVPVEPTAT